LAHACVRLVRDWRTRVLDWFVIGARVCETGQGQVQRVS